ncbi:G1/S-specific cyclin-E1-like [Cimex lectularius]|uniref:Cyclin-like domain-containing protein n=1 Tax=Cimex lectularius TaxID=79782 RepID=A0A8I6SQS5_CIMLE|nr:G1/S-specific cyclin-E1-like [Cimex lectularius]XP_024086180.1 G1/S-specific cyclin-E1-like [Cimex lectularius]
MQRQSTTVGLKRKRRPSDSCENIENEPVILEKKRREDRNYVDNDNHTMERIPLTELSVLALSSTQDHDESSDDEAIEKIRSSIIETDDSDCDEDEDFFMSSLNSGDSSESNVNTKRSFGWLSYLDFWSSYCDDSRSATNIRLPTPFVNHPNLQPRMRSVLLEWLIEVCDVYKLHRETYYLALDYLDRFLSITKNRQKTQLQLIGVTCLLIAAKYEEIFPPKVSEFAYITDGACTEEEIIKMELVMIKAIDWRCTILSANGWLSTLMQLVYYRTSSKKQDIMIQQYSVKAFSKVAQLLDLVSLDEGFLSYSYKILAVSTMYLAFSKSNALSISGLALSDIITCVSWMEPFWDVLKEKFPSDENVNTFPSDSKFKPTDFSHTVLKHTVTLELLEAGQAKLLLKSDPKHQTDVGLLTPPLSSKKQSL